MGSGGADDTAGGCSDGGGGDVAGGGLAPAPQPPFTVDVSSPDGLPWYDFDGRGALVTTLPELYDPMRAAPTRARWMPNG